MCWTCYRRCCWPCANVTNALSQVEPTNSRQVCINSKKSKGVATLKTTRREAIRHRQKDNKKVSTKQLAQLQGSRSTVPTEKPAPIETTSHRPKLDRKFNTDDHPQRRGISGYQYSNRIGTVTSTGTTPEAVISSNSTCSPAVPGGSSLQQTPIESSIVAMGPTPHQAANLAKDSTLRPAKSRQSRNDKNETLTIAPVEPNQHAINSNHLADKHIDADKQSPPQKPTKPSIVVVDSPSQQSATAHRPQRRISKVSTVSSVPLLGGPTIKQDLVLPPTHIPAIKHGAKTGDPVQRGLTPSNVPGDWLPAGKVCLPRTIQS